MLPLLASHVTRCVYVAWAFSRMHHFCSSFRMLCAVYLLRKAFIEYGVLIFIQKSVPCVLLRCSPFPRPLHATVSLARTGWLFRELNAVERANVIHECAFLLFVQTFVPCVLCCSSFPQVLRQFRWPRTRRLGEHHIRSTVLRGRRREWCVSLLWLTFQQIITCAPKLRLRPSENLHILSHKQRCFRIHTKLFR